MKKTNKFLVFMFSIVLAFSIISFISFNNMKKTYALNTATYAIPGCWASGIGLNGGSFTGNYTDKQNDDYIYTLISDLSYCSVKSITFDSGNGSIEDLATAKIKTSSAECIITVVIIEDEDSCYANTPDDDVQTELTFKFAVLTRTPITTPSGPTNDAWHFGGDAKFYAEYTGSDIEIGINEYYDDYCSYYLGGNKYTAGSSVVLSDIDNNGTNLEYSINDNYKYRWKGEDYDISNGYDHNVYATFYVNLVDYELNEETGWTNYGDNKYYVGYEKGVEKQLFESNSNYTYTIKKGGVVVDKVEDVGTYEVTLTPIDGLYWKKMKYSSGYYSLDTNFSNAPITLTFVVATVVEVDNPEVEGGFWDNYAPSNYLGYYDSEEHKFLTDESLDNIGKLYTVELASEINPQGSSIKDRLTFKNAFEKDEAYAVTFTVKGFDEENTTLYKWKGTNDSDIIYMVWMRKSLVNTYLYTNSYTYNEEDGTYTKTFDYNFMTGVHLDTNFEYSNGTKRYYISAKFTNPGGEETIWYDNFSDTVIDNRNVNGFNVVGHAGTYIYTIKLIDKDNTYLSGNNTGEVTYTIQVNPNTDLTFNVSNYDFEFPGTAGRVDTSFSTCYYCDYNDQHTMYLDRGQLYRLVDGKYVEVNYAKDVGTYRLVYKIRDGYEYDCNFYVQETKNNVSVTYNISDKNDETFDSKTYEGKVGTFCFDFVINKKAVNNVLDDFSSNMKSGYSTGATKLSFIYDANEHYVLKLNTNNLYDNISYIIEKKNSKGEWEAMSSLRHGVKDAGEYRLVYTVNESTEYTFNADTMSVENYGKELLNVSEDGSKLIIYFDVNKYEVETYNVSLSNGSSFTYNGKELTTAPIFTVSNTIIELPYTLSKKGADDTFVACDKILDAGEYKLTIVKNESDYSYTFEDMEFTVTVNQKYVEVKVNDVLEYGDSYNTYLEKLEVVLDSYDLSDSDLETILGTQIIAVRNDCDDYIITEDDVFGVDDYSTAYPGYYELVFVLVDGEKTEYNWEIETDNYVACIESNSMLTINRKYVDITWTKDDYTYTAKNQTGAVKAYYLDNKGDKVYLKVSNTNGDVFKNADEYRYTATFDLEKDGEEYKQSDLYILPAVNTKEFTIKKADYDWSKVVFDTYKIEYEDYLEGLNNKVDYEDEVAVTGLNEEFEVVYDLSTIRPYLGKYTITASITSKNYNVPSDKEVLTSYFIVGVKSQTINKTVEENTDEIATIEAVDDNVLDPTLFLVVEIIKEELVEEEVLKEEIDDQVKISWTDQVISVYDVSLIDENNIKQQPDGTLKVALKIPEEIVGGNYRIYHRHVDENGNVEITEVDIDQEVNGYAVFTTDKLSEFVFVYKYTSLLWLIIILSILILGALFLIGYQVYKQIKDKGLFNNKKAATTLAVAPIFFMAGHVPAVVILAIILFVLLVINLILYIKFNVKFTKKEKLQVAPMVAAPVSTAQANTSATPIVVDSAAPVVAAPVVAAPIYVVAPAVEETKTLEESIETLETVSSDGSICKKSIADYLACDDFTGKTEVHRRANYTAPAKGRLIGLPLADTHYVIVNGKRVCFTYVYENNNGSVLMLLKTSAQHIEMLKNQHPSVAISKFPKTTQALKWYSLPIDETYSDQQVFELLREAMKAIEDSSYVAVANPQDAWIVEQQDYLKKNTITIEEDADGQEVIGVFFERRQHKLYFFKYEGVEFAVGEVASYRAIEGDDRKVVVAIPRIKRSASKLHFPVKSLNKIQ